MSRSSKRVMRLSSPAVENEPGKRSTAANASTASATHPRIRKRRGSGACAVRSRNNPASVPTPQRLQRRTGFPVRAQTSMQEPNHAAMAPRPRTRSAICENASKFDAPSPVRQPRYCTCNFPIIAGMSSGATMLAFSNLQDELRHCPRSTPG